MGSKNWQGGGNGLLKKKKSVRDRLKDFYCTFNNQIKNGFSLQLCVQNSPQEARNMLLQNPQLAYALLQAQVVMRIVDPEIALVRTKR